MKQYWIKAVVLGLTLLMTPTLVSAQTTRNQREQKAKTDKLRRMMQTPENLVYTLEEDTAFSHISWRVDVGASLFDGDVWEPNGKKLVPTADAQFTAGAAFEYSFNPIFGLGLEYQFIPYKAGARNDELWYNLKGLDNEIDLYLSLSVLNLFYRTRPQTWGLYLNGGLGLSIYNAKMTNKYNNGEIVNNWGDNIVHEPMDLKRGLGFTMPVGLAVEYNIDKRFAVGLSYEYRFHTKDNYEGNPSNVRKGTANDGFHLITASFRHKVAKKRAFHIRNFHYGDPTFVSLNNKIVRLEEMLKELPDPDSCCNLRAEEIARLREEMNRKFDSIMAYGAQPQAPVGKNDSYFSQPVDMSLDRGVDRDRDGVPDLEDRCPDLKGSVANHGCPELKEEEIAVFARAMRGIQFDTNKATIKPVSYPILDQIVKILRENPSYNVIIVGHTDNVGGATYNKDLSSRRARSVRQYLVNMGVHGERLRSEGKGLSEPIATNSTIEGRAMNRRVEFIVK